MGVILVISIINGIDLPLRGDKLLKSFS